MIQVMIVDDHKMVREGLKRILELNGDIEVIDEADNGKDFIKKLKTVKPDIVLLDINMPEMNGIEVLEYLSKRKKTPKVLVLTVHNEIEYLTKAVDLGIDGYILKDSEAEELIKEVHFVYNGETFIQPSLIPLLNSRLIAREFDQDKVNKLFTAEVPPILFVDADKYTDEKDKKDINDYAAMNGFSIVTTNEEFEKMLVISQDNTSAFDMIRNMLYQYLTYQT